jgi:bifunctional non-homologous end joining protein LigD
MPMKSRPTANGSANENPASAANNYPRSGASGSGSGTSGPSGPGGSGSLGSGASGPFGVSGATGPGTGSAGTVGVSGTTGPTGSDGVGISSLGAMRAGYPGAPLAERGYGLGVPPAKRMDVEVEGRRLSLVNLDKVFYPATGFTKGQVIEYYTRIAPVLLPHLRGRHLTLKRYPDGVDGQYFYEKQCPGHRPDWVRTAGVWSRHNGREIDYCLADDLATIVWLANLADLEMHTPLARAAAPEAPTVLAFDLDPGPPATIVDCAEVALALRDAFDHFGLVAFPKTSGSKGMQIYVPLNTPTTYRATKPFAQGVAQVLERRHPDLVVSEMRRDRRAGKVFIDWSQNDEHKTTVCVYSLRAREQPTVSTPVTWDEVEAVLRSRDTDELAFTSDDVLARVAEHGDCFAPVRELEQELPA